MGWAVHTRERMVLVGFIYVHIKYLCRSHFNSGSFEERPFSRAVIIVKPTLTGSRTDPTILHPIGPFCLRHLLSTPEDRAIFRPTCCPGGGPPPPPPPPPPPWAAASIAATGSCGAPPPPGTAPCGDRDGTGGTRVRCGNVCDLIDRV